MVKDEIDQYCKDVLSGKIISCQHIKMAIRRYKSDLQNAKKQGWYFDEAAATVYIAFIEMLPHVKGQPANERRLLKLEPVQKFIIWNLFGWKIKQSGARRFRHAYIEMAKKNAKSTLAAAIALAMMILDQEAGAEIYSAATTSEQANEVFQKAAVKMWQKSPWLQTDTNNNPRITKSQYQLNYDKIGAFFKALPGDADTAEGKNAHCAIVDEYHVHKTDELINNLVSGSITRTQPLVIRITTAGVSRKVPCYRYRQDCINVLKGITHDETLFIMIFTLDDKDFEGNGWKNEKNWPKAHPLWYSNPELRAGVRSEYKAAIRSASKEVDFKTKMLSIWTDTAKSWITDTKWMRSAGVVDEEKLLGRECFGGLDLSKSGDFSSLVLLFPMDDGTFQIIPYFWLPEERAMNRSGHHYNNFLEWRNSGHMYLTDGDTIDHQYIRKEINDLSTKFVIHSMAYDRSFAVTLVTELTQDGIVMNPFRQNPTEMSAPISEMETLILKGNLHHGGHPVMRWMMSNVLIQKTPHGNLFFNKDKAHEAIDGPVSAAMSIGHYMSVKANEKPVIESIFV
ncbi:MAG: terminase TerL endonuclease subunit [Bacteroidia bacterium]|jgi:phage terminase large subunit-like protein